MTVLPWRSQKAPISFSNLVDFFILKKTSLLLSVTLMFRCSVCAGASWRSAGEPFSCCSDDIVAGLETAETVEDEVETVEKEEVHDQAEEGEPEKELENGFSVPLDNLHVMICSDGGLHFDLLEGDVVVVVVMLFDSSGRKAATCCWK